MNIWRVHGLERLKQGRSQFHRVTVFGGVGKPQIHSRERRLRYFHRTDSRLDD